MEAHAAHGTHDLLMVGISVLIAVIASYVSLDLAAQARRGRPRSRYAWPAAALVMGSGIWTMHFVGMLAFRVPLGEPSFGVGLTALSMAFAVLGTGGAFFVINRFQSRAALAGSGIVMGLSVAAMHYTGMAALRIPFAISYAGHLVALSVLIAIGASIVALWLALRRTTLPSRLAGAVAMGAAIAGMHYVSMAAMTLEPLKGAGGGALPVSLSRSNVVFAVAAAALILLVALASSILERRRAGLAEQDAKAFAQRLGDILESATDCVLVLDRSWQVTYLNRRAAAEIPHGGRLLGRSLWETLPQATGGLFEDACRRAMTSREAASAEFHDAALRRWYRINACPCQDGLAVFFRNITEEKTAEEALRQSEARYRLLAENATDIIFCTDLSGHRRYVSPAIRDILGHEPEERIGKHVTDLMHPADAPAVQAAWDDLVAERALRQTLSYRFKHKAGHWVWLESHLRLVRDDQGSPVQAISVVRDITPRVRLEEQLRQAQKMEVLGQLTGGIAHDFNNLLSIIIGNSELLVDALNEPERRLAQTVLESAEKGAELNEKLLAFGRRHSLKPVRLDIPEVVTGMLPLLQRSLGAHIELRTVQDPGELVALTDRTLLESAILNLAVNARDAMPKGGTLTIATGQRTAGPGEGALPIGQQVAFVTVSDTGSGMSADVLSRVFEPFFTTKGIGRGSGLGLSMVYGFVQQAGGHVAIASAPGEGTSVTILLPAITNVDSRAPAERSRDAPSLGGKRILLVEDEPRVLEFVSSQLTTLGYEVTAASVAADALRILMQGRDFDLLFTDVVMPGGMSGVELGRRAREISPHMKVLLTSGYSEEVFEQHGRPEAGTLLLRKPYKRKQLAETLSKVFDAGASQPRPTSVPAEV